MSEGRVPGSMRAVVYHGVDDLRLETVPVPRTGRHEVLVRVEACGVCPTDIKKIRQGTVSAPRILGHETAGTIARTGSGVTGWSVGDRVAVHHHVPCRRCHACLHGAFAQCPTYLRTGVTAGFEPAGGGYAEYVRVMPFCLPGLVRVPARNTFAEAALLEPVNTVLKAVARLPLLRGDTVVVAGQGPIGLLFTGILSLRGMRVLATDLLPGRRRRALEWGAARSLAGDDPDLTRRIRRATGNRGADAVVVTVPSDAVVTEAQEQVRGDGAVLLFAHTVRGRGTPLDLARICVDEKALVGSYSSDITLQPEAARLVFSRRLDVRRLITHTFPLESTVAAIDLAARPTPGALKVMVAPGPATGAGAKTRTAGAATVRKAGREAPSTVARR